MGLPTSTSAPNHRCAYCDGPLPAEPAGLQSGRPVEGPRYCCYGCRLLGESGQKPIPNLEGGTGGWFKIAVGAVIAGQAMLLGLAVNLAPPEGVTRWLLHLALLTSSLGVFAILGGPLLRSVAASLHQRQITIEQLFLAGIFGAFFASLYSTLTGAGAIYYEVVAVLLTVYTIGKTLGAQSRARALAESRKLREVFDRCEKLGPDGKRTATLVSEIQPGDRVLVGTGEAIPIDGQVIQGQAFVRETPLTGEPFPVVRRPGDAVFAGSYSEDGELIIAATVPGTERRLDGLLNTVERAQNLPSRLQTQADRLVTWFLPLVLVIAATTFGFWTWHATWSVGLFNAMAVLLVACPCAMGLATPIALWNGIAVLATRGFVVSRGDTLDRLASLAHVVFDKTGTLSEESASMIDLTISGEPRDRRSLVAILAAVQAHSRHPVARAFESLPIPPVESPNERNPGVVVKAMKAVPARGIEAWVECADGQEMHLRIGQREFMPHLAAEPSLLANLRYAPLDHLIYVAVDGQLRAIAAVRERLRSTTREAIETLQNLGLTSSVMTGDQPERAARLGLLHVQGRLSPQEKAMRVAARRLSGQGVAFVGDGVNDAPAIGEATVGIAMEHAAGITAANAGAVLYGGDLGTVAWAIALCRQVQASIRSNLIFAAVYNLIGVVLAATGHLHPVVAALLMVVSSFTVSWRALRSTQTAESCCLPAADLPRPRVTPNAWRRIGNFLGQLVCRAGLGSARTPLAPTRISLRPAPTTTTPLATGTGFNTIYGALLLLQAPFLIYLGQLSLMPAFALIAILAALAAGMVCYRALSREALHYAHMTCAMLGAGNWGMMLGWWADAGFSPMPVGCAHCLTHSTYTLASIVNMPWMNLGMLLLGLPPMLLYRSKSLNALGRLPLGLLSAVGMILGMSYGSFLFLKWFGASVSQRFLLSFAGMTVGMLAGMFFCCELGRAIVIWRRARQ